MDLGKTIPPKTCPIEEFWAPLSRTVYDKSWKIRKNIPEDPQREYKSRLENSTKSACN